MKANLNDDVIIYPNKKGWERIEGIYFKEYGEHGELMLSYRRTEQGGYKDHLWSIIDLLHQMFYMGTPYFNHMNIDVL